jgi:protein-disulfide isomerase-like protein with CxxC motif
MYDSKKSMDIIIARAARDVEHKEILSRFQEAVYADDQDRADSIVAELKKFNSTPYCECHAKFEDCGYQDCCR